MMRKKERKKERLIESILKKKKTNYKIIEE